jgi:prevent-host-death family protein
MTTPRSIHEVSEREAGHRFDELLDQVEQGDEIVITRDGRFIARLIPVEPEGS